MLVAGNHRPQLRNVDEAMRRRLHLVPFDVTILKKDRNTHLAETLKAEWPGILEWMIQGCLAYQEQGLNPPERVLAASDAYFYAEDSFSAWLSERCDEGPNYSASPSALFDSWSSFAASGRLEIGNRNSFADKLEAARFVRKKAGSKGRYWKGIRLKERMSDADEEGDSG